MMKKQTLLTQSQSIRDNFRKQIRRRQVQQLFATKRRLIAGSIDEQQKNCSTRPRNLRQLFQAVVQMKDLNRSLTNLGNFLYQNQCLSKHQQLQGRKATQYLCTQIVQTIFDKILPSLSGQLQQELQNRKICLTIVNNIVADGFAPHCQLIPIISQGINKLYPNISQVNFQQSTEIGWLISNIFCHKLDLSVQSELQKPIEQILTIAQEIMLLQDLQIIVLLFKNLKKFYLHVDSFFKNTVQPNTQIEHFKIYRLILIQNTVNYNLNLQSGAAVLLPAIDFVETNLLYIDSCHQKIRQDMCQMCFKILQCTSSDKIMVRTLQLIKLIIKRDIITIIVKDHFNTIQKCILYFGVVVKIQALRLLSYLLVDKQITVFMVEVKDLQNCICSLIQNVRDSQTHVQLILLTRIIIDQTDGLFGKKILKTIEECLSHKVGIVGQYASHILASQQNYK